MYFSPTTTRKRLFPNSRMFPFMSEVRNALLFGCGVLGSPMQMCVRCCFVFVLALFTRITYYATIIHAMRERNAIIIFAQNNVYQKLWCPGQFAEGRRTEILKLPNDTVLLHFLANGDLVRLVYIIVMKQGCS